MNDRNRGRLSLPKDSERHRRRRMNTPSLEQSRLYMWVVVTTTLLRERRNEIARCNASLGRATRSCPLSSLSLMTLPSSTPPLTRRKTICKHIRIGSWVAQYMNRKTTNLLFLAPMNNGWKVERRLSSTYPLA
jgi:hypothetical protein